MQYPICDFFSKTEAQICFKFFVDVSWLDSYQICRNLDATPTVLEIELLVTLCIFYQFLFFKNMFKTSYSLKIGV